MESNSGVAKALLKFNIAKKIIPTSLYYCKRVTPDFL